MYFLHFFIFIFRANHPSNSISDFYKISLTTPLLNYLSIDLSTRFSNNSLLSYTGLYLIPSKVVLINADASSESLKELVLPFLKFYEDFPSFRLIDKELELWEKYWITKADQIPNNVSSALKSINFDGFENIKVALRILGTLPITSC